MNEIERLKELLERRFPAASIAVDEPARESGSWWIDVELKGHAVVVEWRPGRGFGISTPSSDDFGVGPDEVYPDADTAFERVKELLLSQTRTTPPAELPLPRLREARSLSQVELARRLAINQGSLSRMERRSDMLIGTLRNVIAAMGGELELRAHFADGVIRIHFEDVPDRPGGNDRP